MANPGSYLRRPYCFRFCSRYLYRALSPHTRLQTILSTYFLPLRITHIDELINKLSPRDVSGTPGANSESHPSDSKYPRSPLICIMSKDGSKIWPLPTHSVRPDTSR